RALNYVDRHVDALAEEYYAPSRAAYRFASLLLLQVCSRRPRTELGQCFSLVSRIRPVLTFRANSCTRRGFSESSRMPPKFYYLLPLHPDQCHLVRLKSHTRQQPPFVQSSPYDLQPP